VQLKRFLTRSSPGETAPERADLLARAGRFADAVDVLTAEVEAHGGSGLETRLIELRREAAVSYSAGPGRSPWPPAYADPFPDVAGRLPEIDAAELTTEVMGGAVAHHGCLVVRGVLDEPKVADAIAAIDRAQAARDHAATGPWFQPFDAPGQVSDGVRKMVESQGGTWLADSPACTALVLGELTAAGVVGAIADHFGERPFFSLQKSTLRRSRPVNKLTAWHQDGSFLGPDVRTMNVWLALSTCGADHPTPGLEVVPKRVDEILPTEGNLGQSSIAFDLVDEVAHDTPVIRPEFRAGDAMIFDERFLHRTFLHEHMTEDRYAIECWFFAPSHGADGYVSFLV
jgi:hypothetical protein